MIQVAMSFERARVERTRLASRGIGVTASQVSAPRSTNSPLVLSTPRALPLMASRSPARSIENK